MSTTQEEIDSYNFDNPPPNNKALDDWKPILWGRLKENIYIRESGRVFGCFDML